ncbi:MAG: dihydropteroate synthase [Candidatus Kariarchaeaceae archaeon]|jgi:dihydropteroate synthase
MKISGTHGGLSVGDNSDPIITGVINLSPESYYKGSIENKPDRLRNKSESMILSGAQILDVGALSTRPVSLYGGKEPPKDAEIKRIESSLSIIVELADQYNVPISIDTQSAKTASRAIELGCSIVNDISGLKSDPNMASTIASSGVDVVIMATNKIPGDPCGIDDTMRSFQSSLELASIGGIRNEKIVIDPAFGGWAGKDIICDHQLISNFDKLRSFGLPIYIGVSRKSTIKNLGGGDDPEDRLSGSVVLTCWLVDNGAHIIRTHDVKATVLGLEVSKQIKSLLTS